MSNMVNVKKWLFVLICSSIGSFSIAKPVTILVPEGLISANTSEDFPTSNNIYTLNSSKQGNQVFVVSSLSANGQNKVTLTITISPANIASVTKTVLPAGPNDVITASFVGNDLTIEGNGLDTSILEVTSNIPGLQRFWVDIDLLDQPTVPEGGPTLTFYCLSYNCPTEERCMPVTTISNNQGNVVCTKPCQSCELKFKTSSGITFDKGGVFIFANTVNYN